MVTHKAEFEAELTTFNKEGSCAAFSVFPFPDL